MSIDLGAFNKCRVLVIGDLMIDKYLWGEVDRISPEAPVQVVSVLSEDMTLGGAGNVVNNLRSLSASVAVSGVVGNGGEGDQLLRLFVDLGVDTRGIVRDAGRPTTRKVRIIAANQHVLRIDREAREDIRSETQAALAAYIREQIPKVDAVLVSDYGKGVVTDSLLRTVIDCAHHHDIVVAVDPKGLDYAKYAGATLITPNCKEASLAAGIEIVDEATLSVAAKKILSTAKVENLLITMGKDGMVLFQPQAHTPQIRIRSEARQVFDVSGAGDTVIAVLGLALASGASLEESARLANVAAGIVVAKVGTAAVTYDELVDSQQKNLGNKPFKQQSVSQMCLIAEDLRRKGRRIVLTNGCFDLLHAGHIQMLQAAKKMGDVLVVAIDDDPSVHRLKGEGRPVISADQRVRILNALDVVDYVVVFSTQKLNDLIEGIRPDILAKGSNYSSSEVTGHEIIQAQGGRVALIPVTEDVSASSIIRHIKNGAV